MTGVVTRALTTVVFFVVGMVLWKAGGIERRAATALKQVSQLRFADAAAAYDALEETLDAVRYVPVLGRSFLEEVRAQRAVARYWLADYAAVEPIEDEAARADADPVLLLAAANAMYRRAPASNGAADRAMKVYASVLKTRPGDADAAYNYEFVARSRGAAPPRGAQPGGEKPPAVTIHGVQGAPPKGADMGQFKVVIPKRGEERKEDPEAGEGKPRTRKG